MWNKKRVTILVVLIACFGLPGLALAGPTQEEVLKSISDNVGESVDPSKFMALGAAVLGMVILMVVLNRRKPGTGPVSRTLNHSGKLMKEVSTALNLKPTEVKRLKSLATDAGVSSPLVLMLCPSALKQAVDRRAAENP